MHPYTIVELDRELDQARAKHPERHTIHHAIGAIAEEYYELLEACIRRPGHRQDRPVWPINHIRDELRAIAAICIRMLEDYNWTNSP